MGCKVRYEGNLIDFSDLVGIYAEKMGLDKSKLDRTIKTMEGKLSQEAMGAKMVEDLKMSRDQGNVTEKSYIYDPATPVSAELRSADLSGPSSFYRSLFGDGKYSWLMDIAERGGVKVAVNSDGPLFAVGSYLNGTITFNPVSAAYLQNRGLYDYGAFESTIAHEAIHGILSKLPDAEKAKLYAELHRFMGTLESISVSDTHVSRILKVIKQDGIEELVTYAFTDKAFSSWLASIDGKGKKSAQSSEESMWKKLARIIAGAFEYLIGRSKLEELVDIMEKNAFPPMVTPSTKLEMLADDTYATMYEKVQGDMILTDAQTKKVSIEGEGIHVMSADTEVKIGDPATFVLGKTGVSEDFRVTDVREVRLSEMSEKEKNSFAEEYGYFHNYSALEKYMRVNGSWDPQFDSVFVKAVLQDMPVKIVEFQIVDRKSHTLKKIQDTISKYQKERGEYDEILKLVLRNVQSEIATLEGITESGRTPVQSRRLGKLRQLRGDLMGVAQLEEIVNSVYDDLKMAEKLFMDVKNENLPIKDRIHVLHQYGRIAKTHSPLFEKLGSRSQIKEFIARTEGVLGDSEHVFSRLLDALELQNEMAFNYMNEGIELLADYLYPLVDEKGQDVAKRWLDQEMEIWDRLYEQAKSPEERAKYKKKRAARIAKRSKTVLTRDHLRDMLKRLDSDVSAWDAWVGEAIQSTDPVLGLFAKELTAEYDTAKEMLRKDGDRMQTAYDKFVKETGRNTTNPEELHKGLYEDISDARNGYKKRRSLVQPYELDRYLENWKKTQEEAKNKTPKEKALLFKNFHAQNSAPVDMEIIEREIAHIKSIFEKGEITEDEFRTWVSRHMNNEMAKEMGLPYEGLTYASNSPSFKNEFLRPNDTYISENWKNLYRLKDGKWVPDNPVGEYHKFLQDFYDELQQAVPKQARAGTFIPARKRKNLELLITESAESNPLKAGKEWVKEYFRQLGRIEAEDVDYGARGLYGEDSQIIPIYLTRYQDPSETSANLTRGMADFAKEVRTFQARASVMDVALMLDSVLAERKVETTVGGITKVVDGISSRFGIRFYQEKPKYANRAYQQFHSAVRMLVFGEMRKAWEVKNPINEKTVMMDKVLDNLMGWTALSSLGLSAAKGAVNFTGATLQNMIDIGLGENEEKDLSPQSFKKGNEIFAKHSKDLFLTDYEKSGNRTWINQVNDYFEIIQDGYVDSFGKRLAQPKWVSIIEQGPAFVFNRIGEMTSALVYGYAYLNEMTYEKDGKKVPLWEGLSEDENGQLVVDPELAKQKSRWRDTLHSRLRNNQGNYAVRTTAPAYSQYAGLRGLMFFRKYLHPGIRKRFYGPRWNSETMMPEEGTYVSSLEALKRNWSMYGKELEKWETLNDHEKKNVQKAVTELVMITGALSVVSALMMVAEANDIEDEPWTAGWAYWHLLYITNRASHELQTFTNPKEYFRIIQDPFIMASTVNKMMKVAYQVSPFGWEQFQQDSGVYKKGDLKLKAAAFKLFGYTGETMAPKQALLNYETAFR